MGKELVREGEEVRREALVGGREEVEETAAGCAVVVEGCGC